MIGEIAARLSGGYMSGWTYPYASGVEVTRGAILAALGRRWSPGPDRNRTSAERAFISIPGKVRSIHGLEAARNTGYVKDIFLRITEGSPVEFPENNVGKCGNIISVAPSREAAVESAESAARSVLIRLATHHPETDAFLASPVTTSFPPCAYTLGPELHQSLDALPDPWDAGDIAGPLKILPFPEFTQSELRDYAGRTPRESLEIIRIITGLALPIIEEEYSGIVLGRRFWDALIRGGYQGAVYLLDTIIKTLYEGGGQNSV
ncbi:hypothetical protein AGMMS49942_30100 [Spirochaetia bacterium]|nr:hypothetical protein AGMMS49942_30100 [Spirochaetia bacterium]